MSIKTLEKSGIFTFAIDDSVSESDKEMAFREKWARETD